MPRLRMPKSRKPHRTFYIVVVDHDRRIFNVLGPMADDTALTNNVLDCQKAGRDVRCFTVEMGQSAESIAAEYAKQMGYKHVTESVLYRPSAP